MTHCPEKGPFLPTSWCPFTLSTLLPDPGAFPNLEVGLFHVPECWGVPGALGMLTQIPSLFLLHLNGKYIGGSYGTQK